MNLQTNTEDTTTTVSVRIKTSWGYTVYIYFLDTKMFCKIAKGHS